MAGYILFTLEGLEKIKAEIETLTAKRPEAVQSLRTAREMGDLSENAAYKVARSELSSLDGRIRHLTYLIKAGRVPNAPVTGKIGIGSLITVSQNGNKLDFEIVGSFESDPAKGKISHVSPLGKAVMGKEAGNKITISTPAGSSTYQVLTVQI